MYRDEAYALLSKELNLWKNKTTEEIFALVESQTVSTQRSNDGEEIKIEVISKWIDREKKKIRVEAIAYGPSHWKLERLEEKILIDLPKTK